MSPRLWLLIVPAVLVTLLAQSVLWVPGYDSQARGGTARLERFIEGSIGDAKLLNPILHADTSSGRIVEQVFDGLLDIDENLELRGRLAESWTLTETAYLVVDESAALPDGSPVSPQRLVQVVAGALRAMPELAGRVREVSLAGRETRVERIVLGEDSAPREIEVTIEVPPRVRIRLDGVDQSLFERLAPVVGERYATDFDSGAHITTDPVSAREAVADRFASLVPATSHHPEIVFTLREGVRFHDGHLLDAGDVEFTYRAIVDPRNLSPRSSDFEPVERVEVIDPRTVRVVYKRLFSPAISAWTIGVLPAHLLGPEAMSAERARRGISGEAAERFGMRDAAFNRAPVGTGPFRFAEWQSDELIHLVRNDDYWDGPPRYREYFFRVIPDVLTQEVEFRSGAVDVYASQPHQAARYREDERYQSLSTLSRGYTYIGYNMRRAPFDDPRVRRALGMAIDTGAIIDYVLYGEGEPTSGPYPRNTRWYDPDIAPLTHRPEEAARLLAAAGYARGADGWLEKDGKRLEFNLITNNGNAIRKAVLAIAQDAWRKLGVKCNTQVFEWAVFLQDFVNTGEFDAVVLGWSMGIDFDLYQLWHSSQTGKHQLNFVGYRSAPVDALIERLRREYDPDTQRTLANEVHRLIAEDQPYTFLFAPRSTRVLDRKIVMLDDEGTPSRLRAGNSGDVFYHFARWRKLAHAPRL